MFKFLKDIDDLSLSSGKSININFEIIKVVHEILYNNKNAELEIKLLAEKLD